MAVADPTLSLESELLAGGVRFVVGCDEVGRGAIAGPVAVGVCAIDAAVGPFPVGLRDSKLLSQARREAVAPLVSGWVRHSAVGLASAGEVDRLGITACLGLAGRRALAVLMELGVGAGDSVVLLDGRDDWLSPSLTGPRLVRTRVKADRDCASVAAASVLAKVHRDTLMAEAEAAYPGYGWAANKGYGSAGHLEAIDRLGASALHRLSWLRAPALPGETA